MNVKEKLVELLGRVQQMGVIYKENQMDERYPTIEQIRNTEVAARLIAYGATVQEWIPVDDRLPGKEEYTATTEYGTEYYIRLLIAYKTDTVEYEIGYYDGYKWMTEMPIRLIKDVVAWMPFPNMPQPPKEADEDDHA